MYLLHTQLAASDDKKIHWSRHFPFSGKHLHIELPLKCSKYKMSKTFISLFLSCEVVYTRAMKWFQFAHFGLRHLSGKHCTSSVSRSLPLFMDLRHIASCITETTPLRKITFAAETDVGQIHSVCIPLQYNKGRVSEGWAKNT